MPPRRLSRPHLPTLGEPPPPELEAALAAEVEVPKASFFARVLRWGIVVFVAVSLAGFAAAFVITQDWTASVAGLVNFQPWWVIPALAVPIFDWLGGGLRLKVLLLALGERLPLLRCTQIAAATSGSAWLTPSGSGGGPTQLFGLLRNGISPGRAGAVNAVAFLANVSFLALAGFTAWAAGAGQAIAHLILPVGQIAADQLFQWSSWAFTLATAIVVGLAFLPKLVHGVLRRARHESERLERVRHLLEELHLSIVTYARSGKLAFTAGFLASGLHFGSRIVLGWLLLRGFGIHAPFLHVVLLHTVIQYLLFFMPTPGGAGIGELITPILMAPFLPGALLVPYTALWRLFMSYVSVAVGSALLLSWLGRAGGSAGGSAGGCRGRFGASPAPSGT